MKICLILLAIREKHIKTTMRYHLTPVGMGIINKLTKNKSWLDVEKKNPHALLLGMQTGAATVENSMEFPQKIKNGTTF